MRPGSIVTHALTCCALVLAWPAGAAAQNSCRDCHGSLDDNLAKPAQLFDDDVHANDSLSCAGCHGGDPSEYDPEAAMAPSKGFLGHVERRAIPQLCNRCHGDVAYMHRFRPQIRTDQYEQYQTSVHGKRLAQGDEAVAVCTDCHSVHDIREVRSPLSPTYPLKVPETCGRCHADPEHMKAYSIPTDQLESYETSVHWQAVSEGGDLSAPTCPTCHGNHGATPPGVADVEFVCGSCHVVFQQLFDKSPHQEAFAAMGMAGCITCHENHAVQAPPPEMLGVGDEAVCTNCHSEGDAGYEAAAGMKDQMDELRAALESAQAMLDRAEQSGMEVSDGRLQWNDAREQLVKARTNVHSFATEPVAEAVEAGLEIAQESRTTGEEALAERDFRRKGLAVSLLAIFITMLGLYLAIRSLEHPAKTEP